MDLKSRMGHNIAEVRRFLGYSIAELSEKTGMTPDRLAKIEAGEVDFDMDVCEIIGKALAKNPADRYQTATEMAQEVSEMASGRWYFRKLIAD